MSHEYHKSCRISTIDRIARSIMLVCALVASSCIMAAAAGTSSLSWMAWFSLLPLFITIRVASPRVALVYGALWGCCLYMFSSVLDNTALVSTSRSIGLLAAVPAIYTYLGARLTRRIGYVPLVLAVGWIIVELAIEPVALRQGLLAGTQGDGALVHIIGGVLGYVFVAFLIAFINAQLLSFAKVVIVSIYSAHIHSGILVPCGWIIQNTFAHEYLFSLRASRPRAPPV